MFEHRDPSGNKFRTYEIDADDFRLFEGDFVSPGDEIGIDIRTGSEVTIDFSGRVATVFYNPMNHSFLLMLSVIINKMDSQFASAEELQPA